MFRSCGTFRITKTTGRTATAEARLFSFDGRGALRQPNHTPFNASTISGGFRPFLFGRVTTTAHLECGTPASGLNRPARLPLGPISAALPPSAGQSQPGVAAGCATFNVRCRVTPAVPSRATIQRGISPRVVTRRLRTPIAKHGDCGPVPALALACSTWPDVTTGRVCWAPGGPTRRAQLNAVPRPSAAAIRACTLQGRGERFLPPPQGPFC